MTTQKPLKLFISYSHEDEKPFCESFTKHLITLKRRGIIEDWHDRKLVAGDLLHEQIAEALDKAELAVFLVSVNLLNSNYINDVELKSILDRLPNNDVRIIPIIVRHCKWQDTAFAKFVATPTDGKPIISFPDHDEGWIQVIDSIEASAKKYNEHKQKEITTPIVQSKLATLNSIFSDSLDNTEIVFKHKHKEEIFLNDIYVFPDIKNIKREYDDYINYINSEKLVKIKEFPEKLLILGSEQSGKTSLCKMLFRKLYNQDYLPILCSGYEIKNSDINELLGKLISKQYENLTEKQYIAQDNEKILIIDDFDKLKINSQFQTKFLENASQIFNRIILISDSSIKYDNLRYMGLSDYGQYEISSFNHTRTGELINKWNSIGRIETIDINELHNDNDHVTRHVDSVIRKNIIPRKPIYILSVIQLVDTVTPNDYSLTSYGHCYQSLIQAALEKSKIRPNEFDTYINYLSEMAYFLYTLGEEFLDNTQLEIFKNKYTKEYIIKSHDGIINTLIKSGILKKYDEQIYFSYRYIFYFYTAKYLTDNLKTCKKEIEKLCENMHMEKYANIIIFLIHHSKDQVIIDEILLHAYCVFDKMKNATLNIEDTKYLQDYMIGIPKLILEQKNIDEERRNDLQKKDDFENRSEELKNIESEVKDDSTRNILSNINRSIRLIEIIGQIIRNRHGSLSKNQLEELSFSAYSSGLKFLTFFITTTKEYQEPILKFVQDSINNKEKLISDNEIAKQAKRFFLMLCYSTFYSVIKKIAHSLGTKDLIPIFHEISEKNTDSDAIQLINISIQLEFIKKIPYKEIEHLYKKLENNHITRRLLQQLVIQHLYLNHVDYNQRQKICALLEIPAQVQPQLISNKQ